MVKATCKIPSWKNWLMMPFLNNCWCGLSTCRLFTALESLGTSNKLSNGTWSCLTSAIRFANSCRYSDSSVSFFISSHQSFHKLVNPFGLLFKPLLLKISMHKRSSKGFDNWSTKGLSSNSKSWKLNCGLNCFETCEI